MLERKRKPNPRYDYGEAAAEFPATAKDNYLRQYYEALDLLISSIKTLFKGEVKVRVLFDGGSHRSFVTSKAACLANSKGVRRELLGINTFSQKCTNAEQREVVVLNLESADGQKSLTLEAVVVPEINQSNQRIGLCFEFVGPLLQTLNCVLSARY